MEQNTGGSAESNSGLTSFSFAEFTENLNALTEKTNTLAEKLGQLDLSGGDVGGSDPDITDLADLAGRGGLSAGALTTAAFAGLAALTTGAMVYGLDSFMKSTQGDEHQQANGLKRYGMEPIYNEQGFTAGWKIDGKNYSNADINKAQEGDPLFYYKMVRDAYGPNNRGGGADKAREWLKKNAKPGTTTDKQITGTNADLTKKKEEAEKRIRPKKEEPKQDKVSKQLVKNAANAVKVIRPNAPNSSATGGATQQQSSMLSSFTTWLGNAFRSAKEFITNTFGVPPGGMDLGLTPNAGVLDAIARAEGTFQTGYNTSLGNGMFLPGGKEQNLVGMSLKEVLDLGDYMLRNKNNRFNSSALGRYQIVGTTLRGAAAALGMDLNTTKFDAVTQDKLAMWILKAQGLGAWEGFKAHPEELANAMAAAGQINAPGSTTMTGGKVSDYITSGFGFRMLNGSRENHLGVDVKMPTGTPLYAASDGIIEYAKVSPGGDGHGGQGLAVQIKAGEGLYFTYGHLSKLNVQKEQAVKKGDLIGLSGGDTGDARDGKSTGAHLHFEIRKGGGGWGTQIDPLEFLKRNEWIVAGNPDLTKEPIWLKTLMAPLLQPNKKPNIPNMPYNPGGGIVSADPNNARAQALAQRPKTPPATKKKSSWEPNWFMKYVMGVDGLN
jgi:murein DD-endopeptidase MepM/ murein hydrolase activator NlpD